MVEFNSKTCSHQSWSGLPQESLEVTTCHQLQQDEPGHCLQAHTYTTHDVLMAELAVCTQTKHRNVKQKRLQGSVGHKSS